MDTTNRAAPQDNSEAATQLSPATRGAPRTKSKPASQSSRGRSAHIGDIEAWTPPDFGDHLRTRIGASIVDQFVAGHTASDVLRELVQNEFDGGGDRLTVTFGRNELEVVGNGDGISADGWSRLSVIVGTGRVVGEEDAGRISPKTNGIGSKNFGLRSLFLFGDEISVYSRGQVASLKLRTLQTGRAADPHKRVLKGVTLRVPYREEKFEKLEPFTASHEARAFEIMASGMLATLVKLASGGRKKGLREVVLRSVRNGRTLSWRQKAEVVRCGARGVSALRRIGSLVDESRDGERRSRRFEELEFTRSVERPEEYAGLSVPAYYRKSAGRISIGVSLPIARGRIDLARAGNFYYPLQAPDSSTGSSVSVSAPFDLDSDRSSLLDNSWNAWLIEEAATLTKELLKEDWFKRFGADAFKALAQSGPPRPGSFADTISSHLTKDACWPTRASDRAEGYAKAEDLVLPDDPVLDGFLDDSVYLHPALAADEDARALALGCGTPPFTINSLVRLRCADADFSGLQTELKNGQADYCYSLYVEDLSDPDLQVRIATALGTLSRRLSKSNRHDLASTSSTLSAAGELRPAKDLVRVEASIWDACPEPKANRLHPALVPHRVIAGLCREFDEAQWLVDAAARAASGRIDPAEREAIYKKLLSEGATVSRRVLAALRESPIARDAKGAWVAPSKMVHLKAGTAKLLASVVPTPSKEIATNAALLKRLKIRSRLTGEDLVAYATSIHDRAETAKPFEILLNKNQHLLTPAIVEKLGKVAFLRARSGDLAPPTSLHVDSPVARTCLRNDKLIVSGQNEALYRRLNVHETPAIETLLAKVEESRSRSLPPPDPEVLYPAIVAALARSQMKRAGLADKKILWVNQTYCSPDEVLVGAQIPWFFDGAVPSLRRPNILVNAYRDLGARDQPGETDWGRFFQHMSQKIVNGACLPVNERKVLLDAYQKRGLRGWPEGLNQRVACLLDRAGRLFSFTDLVNKKFVEGDYPELVEVLASSGSSIGIADPSAQARPFFDALRIVPLTSIIGSGTTIFGSVATPPLWYKSKHTNELLGLLRRPLVAWAMHELALRQRHMGPGFRPVPYSKLRDRMKRIQTIEFYHTIFREYLIDGKTAKAPVEAAVKDEAIGLVSPKTKLDFRQLVAQALADLAGASNLAQARTLSSTLFPLVLCETTEDVRIHLRRMGVDPGEGPDDGEDRPNLKDEELETTGEEIVRQVMLTLDVSKPEEKEDTVPGSSGQVKPSAKAAKPSQEPTSGAPEVPTALPDLEKVVMSVATPSTQTLEPRAPQSRLRTGASSGWSPRSGAEVERDHDVGRRGEQLVYQQELERVRALGHAKPEDLVIWTSRDDPGADHDIRSIAPDGRPRWIEVKSTTGTDGYFEWSRKEFEKALREGDHYELWRVYQVATTTPVAKPFVNPLKLLSSSRITLELGSFRACVEGVRTED